MVFSSAVGFSRNVGYSLIIKPKIELRQLNMSGRIDWTLCLKSSAWEQLIQDQYTSHNPT